jgi:hypothetical protein
MSGRGLSFHEIEFEQNRFAAERIASGHGPESTIVHPCFRFAPYGFIPHRVCIGACPSTAANRFDRKKRSVCGRIPL